MERFIQLGNTGLHFNCGAERVLVVLGIWLWADKDREDYVAEKFVDSSIVGKKYGNENLQYSFSISST